MPDIHRLKRRVRRVWKQHLKRVVPIVLVALLAVSAVTVAGFAILRPDVEKVQQAEPRVTLPVPTATTAAVTGPALKPIAAGALVMFIGDSWTAGTGADEPAKGYPYFAAEKLGVEPEAHGYGSVGYVNKGEDKFGAFQARLDRDNPDVAPALVVLQGSQNDTNEPPAAITAAAVKLVADVRGRFPKAQLVMVGPAPATVGLMGPLTPVDAALREAATAAKVPYISPLTELWFNAGNLPSYINPMDGSPHPSTAGHQNFGARLAASIKALAN